MWPDDNCSRTLSHDWKQHESSELCLVYTLGCSNVLGCAKYSLGPEPKWCGCDVIQPSDLLSKHTAFSVLPTKGRLAMQTVLCCRFKSETPASVWPMIEISQPVLLEGSTHRNYSACQECKPIIPYKGKILNCLEKTRWSSIYNWKKGSKTVSMRTINPLKLMTNIVAYWCNNVYITSTYKTSVCALHTISLCLYTWDYLDVYRLADVFGWGGKRNICAST